MQKVAFGSGEAAATVAELRASYMSGKTRSYEWRVSQLKKLEMITEFHEQEIVEALRSDLSKPEFESYVQEDTCSPKPLAAYLFTSNQKLKDQFVVNVSAGGLVINDTTIHLAVPTLPFGGVGESGMGAYHGKFSFEAFIHKKAVLCRGFFGDAAVRYPPYTKGKLTLLKALVGSGFLGIIRALFGSSKASLDIISLLIC